MPRKSRRNRGWFRRGFDPRRHVLTTEERERGGHSCMRRHYFGGAYAAYLGQTGDGEDLELEELAELAGDKGRPGGQARHH